MSLFIPRASKIGLSHFRFLRLSISHVTGAHIVTCPDAHMDAHDHEMPPCAHVSPHRACLSTLVDPHGAHATRERFTPFPRSTAPDSLQISEQAAHGCTHGLGRSERHPRRRPGQTQRAHHARYWSGSRLSPSLVAIRRRVAAPGRPLVTRRSMVEGEVSASQAGCGATG